MSMSDVRHTLTGARDDIEAQSQLLADLQALAPSAGVPPAAADFLTRPSVLRRVARRLASHVPAGTDRLLVPALPDAPLGAAVSLASGVPFAAFLRDGGVYGEAHASEQVVLLVTHTEDLPALAAAVESARLLAVAHIAVAGTPDDGATSKTRTARVQSDVFVLMDELRPRVKS